MTDVALSELRLRAQRLAEMENSQFVVDDEWSSYINEGNASLYDIICETYGDDYYIKSEPIAIQPTVVDYALPSDFYRLEGVDWNITDDYAINLRPYARQERNKYSGTAYRGLYLELPQYRLRAVGLRFIPEPRQANTVTLQYVPVPPFLVNDTDTFGFPNRGWSEYTVIYAAIKALEKQNSEVASHETRLAQLEMRIRNNAPRRNEGEAYTVSDINQDGRRNQWWGYLQGLNW